MRFTYLSLLWLYTLHSLSKPTSQPAKDYAREHSPCPRVAAGAQVHGLPPPADGGGGRARERRAGLGGAQLAAGQGDAISVRASDCGGRLGMIV